ncbi:MAG: acetyl ornithine aminotransferase family protein [Anaerolineae bacterium]|nr:acetyl ornithine aminotransferase family protein [Anaerolineae bacterium]
MMTKPGPKAQSIVARDAAAISPSYTRPYPLVVERAQGSEVWDVDGNHYIDFAAGIAVTSTGHCHPRVVKAIQEQAAKLIHIGGTDFYYELQVKTAEELDRIAPFSDDARTFLTNSGAESIEAAIKLARWATGRARFIAFHGAFHGRTLGALSFTASKAIQRAGFFPMVPGVTHVPYANPKKCVCGELGSCHKLDGPCRSVAYIEDVVFKHMFPGEEVAAVLVEPIQGEGGYIVPCDCFLSDLRSLCDKYGMLLIVDEVQSGMGRTGKWFAIEHWGVEPDIVAIAKGIASGMPLGAMIARKGLMTWPPGAHGNTFGGNPIACAAALATIDLIENGDEITGGKPYRKNAAEMGEYIVDALDEMKPRHPSIVDVRGKGLMLGVEFGADGQLAPDLRDRVVESAFERGLIVLPCGPSAMRIAPPLNINKDLVDRGLILFDQVLTEAERG